MTAPSLLKVMSWFFLIAGIAGVAISAAAFLGEGTPAAYGAAAIGGTFWLLCAAVAFYLRYRLD